MATLALQAAGTSFGGPAGGVIGAAIGSYVDNAWIMPALFPMDPVKGQSLQELQLQGADEGDPISRLFSQRVRVAGEIIWTPRGFNNRTESESGGKGGPSTEQTFYSVDLAVAFGDGPPDGLGVEAIDRIYADTSLIYDDSPNVNISSNLIAATVREEYVTLYNIPEENYDPIIDKKFLVLTSPANGPDLSDLRSGNNATIDGWTETDYNLTSRCVSSSKANDGSTTAQFKLPKTASSAGEAAGNTITIDQTNPKFDTSKVANVTIYLGTEAQTKDSFIVSVEGADNTPGYRRVVYAVIEGFELEDYGRIPNFRAEAVRDSAGDLQQVVDDILGDSDLDSSEWDSSALTGVTCKGYTLRGPIPTVSAFQPLATAFNLLAQDLDGVLTFFLRQNASIVTIAEEDLAAHQEDERGGPWPHRLDRKADIEPPSEVLVKYIDEEKELGTGEQRERRPTAQNLFEKKAVEIAITMNGGEARDIAAKLLWTSKTGSVEHEIIVPPSYAEIVENDILVYTYESQTYRFLVQEVTDGADGTRVATGFGELPAHMTQNSPYESPRSPDTHLASAYDMRLEAIDVAPLEAATSMIPGIYFEALSRQQGSGWHGASLYQSGDEGLTWSVAATFQTEATMGSAEIALAKIHDAVGWDRGSTLTVVVEHGTLSSVTELECLNGRNRAVVGAEVIGFKTATLASTQPAVGTRYDLTYLLRGLGGTEREMGVHQAGERFVVLSESTAMFLQYNTSAIGGTRTFAAVSPGGDPDDFDAQAVPIICNNVRPLSPVHLFGERNAPATNDWTVVWTRRSRQYFRIFSQSAPQVEPIEDYVIDVMDATGLIVVNTYTSTATANGSVVSGTQFMYDAQDQIDDYGSVQSTIRIRVYQISDLAGRGKGTATTAFTG